MGGPGCSCSGISSRAKGSVHKFPVETIPKSLAPRNQRHNYYVAMAVNIHELGILTHQILLVASCLIN
jgi:hypothetical protein